MNVNTNTMVSISEANQNFSKVARLVDQYGSAVILKNNSPRYLILEFNQADEQLAAPTDDVLAVSKKIIARNKMVYMSLQNENFTKEQILLLHSQLIENFGGSSDIRDEALLDSAINTPFQTYDGEELYPTLLDKASRLCFGLVKNHPFVDGNKRIGTHAMLVFLAINGIDLEYSDIELIELILSVASGTQSDSDILRWLQQHII